ncbi:putative glycosyltransferase [Gordonia rhizosphera NBRC 16068]|uniref:Putative glycosyltransferase n=1 Tax=Gordonia rhizosphera NBRC 16068 TaxID=1108045 RepID=K6WIH9_9ACTN|nr:putative glycosyltransferase [Gordonia rhizosphera NBRC 16068]
MAGARGIVVEELPGLAAQADDDDTDAGAKLSHRAARIATALAPRLVERRIDLVVSDVITVGGAWAAELAGIAWIELSPHPLYLPSKGLPPIGAGLEPGTGPAGRLRDAMLRTAARRSLRQGERQRERARGGIGLHGRCGHPVARFVATLPALEVRRPDWPADTHLVGPLLWEPTDDVFERPTGPGPLVLVAPSTASTGATDMASVALAALSGEALGMAVRVVVSALERPRGITGADGVVIGSARQDEILAEVDLVVCGAGHGMLAKALAAGVPVVTVPGGGDQWELANRVRRQGSGLLVRPVEAGALASAVATVLSDPGFGEAARRAAASSSAVVDPVRIVEGLLAARDG